MGRDDDWVIPAEHDECARCQAPMAPGTVVTTVLQLAAEGPSREDLCEGCGEAVGDESNTFFWRRKRPESDQPTIVVDYALLREAFPHLCSRTEELYERLAYLVGLVLVRKRMLRLVGFEVREGREVMIVTRGAGQPTQVVPAPHLSAEALVEAREQLGQLLSSELPDLTGTIQDVNPED
jgi:hypothetical protein